MKPKHFALAVLAVLIGIGLWWFTQPAASVVQKTAAIPSPKPAPPTPDVPQPAPHAAPIAAPVAPPVQTKQPTAAPAPKDADPQANLQTAIRELARLFHEGDVMQYFQMYTPPDKLTPAKLQSDQEWLAKVTAPGTGDTFQKVNEGLAKGLEALENQTPTYNAAGDEATYMLYVDVGGIDPEEITFIKINGKWYKKDDE